jgi:hypothetical protein
VVVGYDGEWNKPGAGVGSGPDASHPDALARHPLEPKKRHCEEGAPATLSPRFVQLSEYTRERVPLDWAMTQNNLGVALAALGKRELGTAHLEEAVKAYQNALLERTRDRVPLQWAQTGT